MIITEKGKREDIFFSFGVFRKCGCGRAHGCGHVPVWLCACAVRWEVFLGTGGSGSGKGDLGSV